MITLVTLHIITPRFQILIIAWIIGLSVSMSFGLLDSLCLRPPVYPVGSAFVKFAGLMRKLNHPVLLGKGTDIAATERQHT
jgi:hypothetical protein